MNTKIMEGLTGASTSMNLLNTPMRVYKEARLKGDTATMERAAGYVGSFAGKAEEYKTEAYKGMKKEAKKHGKKQRRNVWKKPEDVKRNVKNLKEGLKKTRIKIWMGYLKMEKHCQKIIPKTALPGQSRQYIPKQVKGRQNQIQLHLYHFLYSL